MLPLPIRITLSIVVFAAAVTDLRSRRIPNWLTFPALPAGLTAQAVFGDGLLAGVLGAIAAFAPMLLLFAIGARGAGDVKLFTAAGAFTGVRSILPLFVIVALVGGAAALIVAMRSNALRPVLASTGLILTALIQGRWAEFRERSSLERPDALRLPYGVVIATGTLLYLWFPR